MVNSCCHIDETELDSDEVSSGDEESSVSSDASLLEDSDDSSAATEDLSDGNPDNDGYLKSLNQLRHSTQNTNKSNIEPNLLYFVLHKQQNANRNQLGLDQLKEEEALRVKLLQHLDYLDIHFAVVTQKVAKLPDKEEAKLNFEVGQWTNSSNRPLDLALKIDFVEQLASDAKTLFNPNQWYSSDLETINLRYYFSVLVIWPKEKTQLIYSKYAFNYRMLMSCIEVEIQAQLSTQLPGVIAQLSRRTDLIRDLSLALDSYRSFLQQPAVEPPAASNAAVIVERENNRLTFRLLKICTHLQAKDVGITLLDLITSASSIRQASERIYEDCVIKAFANFVAKLTGI